MAEENIAVCPECGCPFYVQDVSVGARVECTNCYDIFVVVSDDPLELDIPEDQQ